VAVVALAALTLQALSRVSAGSYSTFSPALFPRVCTYGLAIGGLVLIARGFVKNGPGLERLPLRPALLVTLGVVAFGLVTPVFGYGPAGLLTMLIAGLATPEVRLRELVLVALGVIVFSIALFSYLLKLTIPILILPGLSL
jgi:putative tricarboxylic transport membrane protein